jgi:O-antigen ligase
MISLSPEQRTPPVKLWRLKIRDLWRFLTRQPLSFWLICFYLFIEYVRPQQVWPVLDVAPWGELAIYGSLAALLFEGGIPRLRGTLAWLYLLFVAVVLASSFAAVRPSDSWEMISLPLSWFLIFLLITNIVTTERRWLVFMLSFLLYSFKMSQHGFRTWASIGFGFQSWGATGGPGWFHNSGEFGIQMCVFFPLSVAFFMALRQYWDRWRLILFVAMPVTAVASMIASSSRGALVGGAAVLAWMVLRSKYRVRGTIYGVLAMALVIVLVPEEQKARFEVAGEDNTSIARITRWKNGVEIAQEYPFLGIGYENWYSYNLNRYGRGGLPHNHFIEAWSELGYLGLFSFLSLIFGTVWVNWGTRRIVRHLGERGRFIHEMAHGLDGALIGYLVSGFFVTVLHYPYFWINLALVVSLRICAVESARSRKIIPPSPAPRRSVSATSKGSAVGVSWPEVSKRRGSVQTPYR